MSLPSKKKEENCPYKNDKSFNVVIVGGGPAAVAAAIYCHRFALTVVMIGEVYSGAISRKLLLENYPGFPEVSRYDLMKAFEKH